MSTTPTSEPTQAVKQEKRKYHFFIIIGVLVFILALFVEQNPIQQYLPLFSSQLHGSQVPTINEGLDFTLTSMSGEPVTLSDFHGKVILLYYGYTYCPDVCPATLADLTKVMAQLRPQQREQVQVLMVTIDPERDTPELLQDYLAHFDDSFIGLTGTEEEIVNATVPFGIYYEQHEGTATSASSTELSRSVQATSGYLIDHTASVVVLDKRGILRTIYPFGTDFNDIVADMRVLTREK